MTGPDRQARPAKPRAQRLGRPRKSADELRTAEARCRLSPAEKQRLTEDAQAAGMSEAEYIRRLITGHKPRGSRSCDPHLLYELNAIGNNLNQAVRDAHIGRPRQHDWEQLYQHLKDVLERVALADVC